MISRPHIVRRLEGVWDRRVTLVVAGAGYGKTTALRQLAHDQRARWLTLGQPDREIESLASHIYVALGTERSAGVSVPGAAIGASDRRGLAEGQAAQICAGLDSGSEALLLILDDVDQIGQGDLVSHFLRTLCLLAPPRLHLVLSGRELPALGLGGLRGRGELMVLEAPDLAFTLEETSEVLVERLGARAASLGETCWALTAGWPAALQLIADRLERIDSDRWEAALQQLSEHRSSPWQEFAAELVERETPIAQRLLAVAGIAPAVTPDLLNGLDLTDEAIEMNRLQARGLLVDAGELGWRLSPVLSDAVARQGSIGETEELRQRIVAWLEGTGRLEEALECAVPGSRRHLIGLIERVGERLIARGYARRVAEVLRDHGVNGDESHEALLAQALVAVGDWDGAMERFAAIQRRSGPAPLPSATAWRFGALLYLRFETEAAEEVLSAAYSAGTTGSCDDAEVAAWLSSTLWSRGDIGQADRVAQVALRHAETSGDASARAAAHVACALVAASRGDRQRNERHYRLALRAAVEAGDSVHMARIHANLSSRAAEEGDFAESVREADLAISAGAGHNLFGALAMSNKADALLQTGALEEARSLISGAIEMFQDLGSLMVSAPYTELAALDAQRGDLARARMGLERALRVAEEADDLHTIVIAMADLAHILVEEDPEAARRYAAEAAARATSLERAYALCAWSLVELVCGDRREALRLAAEAEAEGRRTSDNPALARAAELRAAAAEPVDEGLLEEAARLWREVGNPIAAERAELMLAACHGETHRVSELRERLSRRGVVAEHGVAALLVVDQQPAEVSLVTMGRFVVMRSGQAIQLAEWQSRKARDLLKMLVARRGRAITREAAAEALWPGEAPGPLANRLSVALSTLRKVLDPKRKHAPDHLVSADSQSLALRIDRLSIDVIAFLESAGSGVALASQGDWSAAEPRLQEAETLYTGDFLEEDLYEDWAVDCREEARSAAQEVTRLLARGAARRGDEEDAARYLRRLLERDRYDADAWAALLGSLLRLHRYGEARRQHTIYVRRMAELAIPPVSLAQTADALP